jgi:hypothetical protein
MLQRGTPAPGKGAARKAPTAAAAAAPQDDLLSGVLGGKRGAKGGGGGGEGAGGAQGTGAPAAEPDATDDVLGDLGKKRKAPRRTFKERNVLDMRGLYKLYQEMQKLPLSRKPGNEVRCAALSHSSALPSITPRNHAFPPHTPRQPPQAADMLRVSNAYRTWAAQLFPPLTSTEVLRKCRDWSGRLLVKSVMATLRTAEAGREAAPLTEAEYSELTEGARRAAEADAARRKQKAAARGVGLEGGSVASNREGDEYEEDEGAEEEVLDFFERQRRARGGEEGGEEEEEEEALDDLDELEALRGGGGGGGGAGGGGGGGRGGGGRGSAAAAASGHGAGDEAGASQESFGGAEEFGDFVARPPSQGAPMVELEDSEEEGGAGAGAGAGAAAAPAPPAPPPTPPPPPPPQNSLVVDQGF